MNNTLQKLNIATKDTVIAMLATENEFLNIHYTIDSGRPITRSKIDTITRVLHPGIILGKDKYGFTWVAHNHIDHKRPVFERLHDYTLGQPYIFDDRPTKYSQLEIVTRAIDEVIAGQRYHPINYNCQTFVNMVVDDSHKSESVDNISDWAIGGGLLLALLGLATDNKALKAIGATAAVAGGASKAYSRYDKQ